MSKNNENTYEYALYHKEDLEVDEILNSMDFIENFEIIVQIKPSTCRGKDPIAERRSRVSIRIKDECDFKKLDDSLENEFVDVWFER